VTTAPDVPDTPDVPEAAPWPADRTAVVTGAGSRRGIGRATADRLAAEGWAVAVLDLDADGARQAAEQVGSVRGVPALGLAADVRDEASVEAAVRRIEAELPPVAALVNLAGVSSPVPFVELTPAEWDRVFDVNMRGTFLVTRRIVPGMIERGLGRVVSVSSISAQRGGGTYSKVAYSAAKAAVIGFTRALARELGPHGITVNCVAPGPVDTDIMGGTLTPERKREMSAGMPVGRVGTPGEVAALLAFLCGPDAGYITAATYDINGGLQVS
jgi:NAD(P)-dependent dehydrogenase (short-subunit alcohol dehydrogenase family)